MQGRVDELLELGLSRLLSGLGLWSMEGFWGRQTSASSDLYILSLAGTFEELMASRMAWARARAPAGGCKGPGQTGRYESGYHIQE